MRVRTGFLLCLMVTALSARDSQTERGTTALASRVPSFRLEHATVFDGVAELTTIESDLAFSFEETLKNIHRPCDPENEVAFLPPQISNVGNPGTVFMKSTFNPREFLSTMSDAGALPPTPSRV